jgi:HPt (histidine-containing phosphotransfer) domain-containing protein
MPIGLSGHELPLPSRKPWNMSTKLTPIDPEVIAHLRQCATPQEPRLFEEIASLFLGDLEKWQASMAEAVRAEDAEKLAEAAHAIGGGGMLFGAHPLAALCRPLQGTPRPSPAEARELARKVEHECGKIRQALETEINNGR